MASITEKVLNIEVCVEENNEKFICPFKIASEMPSKDKEGYNIYNFIVFTYPSDGDYLKTGFRKMCIDSWHIAFSRIRIIYIDVSKCLDLCKWTEIYYVRKSYPTDPLRPLFLSFLDNGIYCDTDVFLHPKTRDLLPLCQGFFVGEYGCSGTFLWNKEKNNQHFMKWFEIYNEMEPDPEDYLNTDCEVFSRFKRTIDVPDLYTRYICNHFSLIWVNIRDNKPFKIKFQHAVGKEIMCASFCKESYYAFMQYCKEKGYEKYISEESDEVVCFL